MTTVTIPLDKNPEVKDLVIDMEPGDRVYGCFSIRAKDDQTLELRIEEMAATRDELPAKGDKSDDDDDDSDETDEGDKGTTDEEDGDGSNDEERESARGLSGY